MPDPNCVPSQFTPGPSGALSYGQLITLWQCAGGQSGWPAAAMASVAVAESGGRATAVSSSHDYGLWQINQGNFSGLGLNGTNVFDPLTNAKAAVALSRNGTNFGDWCTAWKQPVGNCGQKTLAFPQSGSPAERVLAGTLGAAGPTAGLGSLIPGGGTATDYAGNQPADSCLIHLPGGICLLSRDQAKKLGGGALMGVGGLLVLVGLAAVVAYSLRRPAGQVVRAAQPIRRVTPKAPTQAPRAADELAQRRANDKALRDAQAAKRASDAREEREGFGPGDRTRRGDEAQRRRTA